MIAAKDNGRLCWGKEADPHYCTIVLMRWEAFTGQRAEKVKSS